MKNLGQMMLSYESADRARALLEEARGITIRAYGPDHPEVAALR